MGNRAMEYKQMVSKSLSLAFTMAAVIASPQAAASSLTVPNIFTSGTATSASEMNANFTAVKAAIDDNNTRISSTQSATNSFQGFSSGTSTGGVGLITLGNLCSSSFAGSHVCTTQEFATSSYASATGLSGDAWIQPTYSFVGSSNALDAVSGVAGTTPSFTCRGWTQSASINDKALTVSSVGKFVIQVCSTPRAVACCI